jgi:PilZ domain
MIVATERRSSPRFLAVRNAALVAVSKAQVAPVAASLIDVSVTGARLRMRARPKLGTRLWVALLHPVKTPSLRGTVVRIDDDGSVAIAFSRPCNRLFFWTATRGQDFRAMFVEASGR